MSVWSILYGPRLTRNNSLAIQPSDTLSAKLTIWHGDSSRREFIEFPGGFILWRPWRVKSDLLCVQVDTSGDKEWSDSCEPGGAWTSTTPRPVVVNLSCSEPTCWTDGPTGGQTGSNYAVHVLCDSQIIIAFIRLVISLLFYTSQSEVTNCVQTAMSETLIDDTDSC